MINPKYLNFTKQIITDDSLPYLLDFIPMEKLLHTVDHLLRTGHNQGKPGYTVETANAVILIRMALKDVIAELHAKGVPARQANIENKPLTNTIN